MEPHGDDMTGTLCLEYVVRCVMCGVHRAEGRRVDSVRSGGH